MQTNTAALGHTVPATREISRADTLKVAFAAAALGVALVFTTGFAGANVLHNAAHDSRHAMSFPCH
ncbi:CbtB domain-containing protein [Methyloraptor flagellatus]|uniref:CbtB domain-containing protein n=1 Tax=Methyloraptor flagellatus TaxID=3162530 RepID=A0AAU7X971_9HYPH